MSPPSVVFPKHQLQMNDLALGGPEGIGSLVKRGYSVSFSLLPAQVDVEHPLQMGALLPLPLCSLDEGVLLYPLRDPG